LARRDTRRAGAEAKSSATDLVLDADRAAEDAIVAKLRAEFPDDEIVSEEGGGSSGTSSRRWYVDPIDGTINFFYGIPHYAIALALEDAGGVLAAIVLDPSRGEMFVGARGAGAWLVTDDHTVPWSDEPTGSRLAVTAADDLAAALVATGFAYLAEARAEQARILDGVLPHVRDIRRFGSAQLDLAWTAGGRLDGYFESVDKPWDWKAGALLVQEAGGRVTQLAQARPGQPHIVASAPRIHEPLVTLLRRAVQSP